jgi:UDP-N-acetylmuramyl pentapeptide phosphotransferase/UDP-N-acetylglucosamine-1-phosphate transferase
MDLFLAAAAGAAIAAFLIVRTRALHLAVTGDAPGGLPQKVHAEATPRIGGLAVVCGLLAASVAGTVSGVVSAPFLWTMVAALLPAFLGGFLEDLTRRVGPVARLLMTLVSAAIAFAWLDADLHRSDVAWLDAAFSRWPLSLAGTLLAVAGLAHAMNLIDGHHGLAAGVGVLALLALALVARRAGDPQLASLGFAAAGAYAGFLLLNWPLGRIFLGDGGAYLLGTTLAIFSAQLVGRHPGVSPWFPLVLVVYPVWETLFSMLRRALRHAPVGAPDDLHLHSLVHRNLVWRLFPGAGARPARWRNACTALPFWALQGAMVVIALAHYDSTPFLVAQAYAFLGIYCVLYVAIARLAPRRPAPTG